MGVQIKLALDFNILSILLPNFIHAYLRSKRTPNSPSLVPKARYLPDGESCIVDIPAIVSRFYVSFISYLL